MKIAKYSNSLETKVSLLKSMKNKGIQAFNAIKININQMKIGVKLKLCNGVILHENLCKKP